MESSMSSLLKPTTMFFRSDLQPPSQKDWESCFSLKAAEVYVAITKRRVDANAMPIASKLLIEIAKNCGDPIGGGADQHQINPNSGGLLRSLSESTMKAIDAVYLIVGVLHDLRSVKPPYSREKLDTHYASAPRHEALCDVVKLCNQLPLSLLHTTVDRFPNALHKALESLKPPKNINGAKDFRLSFDKTSFHGAVDLFCWYFSPFHSKPPSCDKDDDKKALFSGKKNLLDCLYASLLVDYGAAPPSGTAEGSADPIIRRPATRLPTATQLAKSGRALGTATPGGGKVVVRAEFVKPAATLRVPAMVFDRKLETVVVNLVEWERRNMEERPVARYVVLLGDLVGEEGDVRVLKGTGVLQGRWKSEREVVELLRRVKGSASCPTAYLPIDDEVEKMMAAAAAPEVNKAAGWFAERGRPAKLASVAVLVSLVVAAIVARRRMD